MSSVESFWALDWALINSLCSRRVVALYSLVGCGTEKQEEDKCQHTISGSGSLHMVYALILQG